MIIGELVLNFGINAISKKFQLWVKIGWVAILFQKKKRASYFGISLYLALIISQLFWRDIFSINP